MLFFYLTSVFVSIFVIVWGLKTWQSDEDWTLFGPFGVLMACFFAYCGFGPALVMSCSDEDNYFGYFYKDYAGISSGIALAAFLFAWLGYKFVPTKKKKFEFPVALDVPQSLNAAWNRGLLMYFAAWFALLIANQFNIGNVYNFLGGERESVGMVVNLGGLRNYVVKIGQSLQAMSVFLLAIAMLSGRTSHKIVSYLLLANSAIIIVASGFRQQLAFLFFCCLCLSVLYLRRNPMWKFGVKKKFVGKTKWIVCVIFALIAAMSIGRSYGSGIHLDRVQQRSIGELLVAPFSETASVYFCGGVASDYSSKTGKKIGFGPVEATLLRAIPKEYIGEKDLPPTLDLLYESLGGGTTVVSAGMAVLCFTEYFLMFGWFGVAVGAFLLGCCCKWVENYKRTHIGFLVSIGYILTSGYIFIYFHRGMMGQQMDGLVFSVIVPIFMMKLLNRLSGFDITRRVRTFMGRK